MKPAIVVSLSLMLFACASSPPVTVRYYSAKSDVTVKVIRTISCDASDNVKEAQNVIITTSHSADLSAPQSFDIHSLDGTWANSDVKFEFYADGRLKGVNASTTGQGEKILTSAISFLSAGGVGVTGATTECAFIKRVGNGKPVTLTFSKKFARPTAAHRDDIPPEHSSEYYYRNLRSVLGTACAIFGAASVPSVRATGAVRPDKDIAISLKQPAEVDVTVKLDSGSSCTNPPTQIKEQKVYLAHLGTAFTLPIPKAVVFGKQSFAVSLDESGALTLLQYGKETGVGQPLAVGKGLFDEFGGKTTTAKAAETKAEADLIAQQQRLVRCLADPLNCT